jgi:hypothetical protein
LGAHRDRKLNRQAAKIKAVVARSRTAPVLPRHERFQDASSDHHAEGRNQIGQLGRNPIFRLCLAVCVVGD